MPRSVFTLWVGGRPTKLALASMRSFVALGHQLTVYAYEPLEDLPAGVTLADASEVLPRRAIAYPLKRRAYAMIAELFRYTRLRSGGLWVDTDVIALRPFDFPEDELVCGWQDEILINVAVLGAPAGHPLIAEVHRRTTSLRANREWLSYLKRKPGPVRQALGSLRYGRTFALADAPFATFGPDLLTKVAFDMNSTAEARAQHVFYPIRWQGVDLLLEPGREAEKAFTPETYCVHLWNEMLRRREIVEPPPGSLLERLLDAG